MAILLGTGLSLVAYLYRTSKPAMRTMGFDGMAADRRFVVLDDAPPGRTLPECPQLKLLRMEGSIYFGAAPYVAERLRRLRALPGAQPHLLVMCKSMNFIDTAGDAVWQAELKARRAAGGDLYFHRPRPQVLEHVAPQRLSRRARPGAPVRRQAHRDRRRLRAHRSGVLRRLPVTLDLGVRAAVRRGRLSAGMPGRRRRIAPARPGISAARPDRTAFGES